MKQLIISSLILLASCVATRHGQEESYITKKAFIREQKGEDEFLVETDGAANDDQFRFRRYTLMIAAKLTLEKSYTHFHHVASRQSRGAYRYVAIWVKCYRDNPPPRARDAKQILELNKSAWGDFE